MGDSSREIFCKKHGVNEETLREVEKGLLGYYQLGDLLLIVKALKFDEESHVFMNNLAMEVIRRRKEADAKSPLSISPPSIQDRYFPRSWLPQQPSA